MIIILLMIFIYGVIGMKLFGNLCGEGASGGAARCAVLRVRCSFHSITESMNLLFELATNQDSSGVMRDIYGSGGGSAFVWWYFTTFYIISNFILINLFVAGAPERTITSLVPVAFSVQ